MIVLAERLLSCLGFRMLVGMTDKTSKIIAVLCVGITIMLGVSCQLHASPHLHAMPAGNHQDPHEDADASALDDLACIAAVIPLIDGFLLLSPFIHEVSLQAVKPIVPSFEFDIPPRSSL
jgi:hypothetical protein